MSHSVTESIMVRRPGPEVVGAFSDLDNLAPLLVGFSKFQPTGSKRAEVGAEYEVFLDVGTIHVGGRVVLTDFAPTGRIAWKSVRGTRHNFTLVLEGIGDRTQVTTTMEYEFAGGMLARLSERIGSKIIQRNLCASLEKIRHHLEFET